MHIIMGQRFLEKNSVDPDQTAPERAVCSESKLFASPETFLTYCQTAYYNFKPMAQICYFVKCPNSYGKTSRTSSTKSNKLVQTENSVVQIPAV